MNLTTNLGVQIRIQPSAGLTATHLACTTCFLSGKLNNLHILLTTELTLMQVYWAAAHHITARAWLGPAAATNKPTSQISCLPYQGLRRKNWAAADTFMFIIVSIISICVF